MSLTKSFFDRKTNITAKVVCDSISEQGIRLTTFEIEYPRFIHAEVMTHRGLSKNSSSSRAIPIQKMIDLTESNPAVPLYWGKNKSGMQADQEIDIPSQTVVEGEWTMALYDAVGRVREISDQGVHKQTVNRLLEPFQMMKVVVTGTDWENFFNLRIHPDAQPEICMLAYKIYEAMQNSEPDLLKTGQWHLPYCHVSYQGEYDLYSMLYYDDEVEHTCEHIMTLEEAIKYSAASCASVSYRTANMTLEKADKIFDMLIKAEVVHSSPLEHCATPVQPSSEVLSQMDMFAVVDLDRSVNLNYKPQTWEEGITHMNKQGQLCSGNLKGWVQYRHLLPNNTAWEFDFRARMKMFE